MNKMSLQLGVLFCGLVGCIAHRSVYDGVDGKLEFAEIAATSKCCCQKAICDGERRMGQGMVQYGDDDDSYCCRPQASCSWLAGDVDAEEHNFKFRNEVSRKQKKLDSQCKQDCTWLLCGEHGRAVNLMVMDSFDQYCECQCDPGWDVNSQCTKKLPDSPGHTIKSSQFRDYEPEISWPLETAKYSADDLATGQYSQCVITKVALENKPIGPNPLLPEDVIKDVQDILRPTGALQPLNAMAHCGLRLYLAGPRCHDNPGSILLEHNEEINAIEWSRDLADAFRPVGQWDTADVTGTSYGQSSELSRLYSARRSPTVFELLYELFSRDPELQGYSVPKKNCCHFARAAAAVLLLPTDLAAFDSLLQNHDVLDEALEQVMGTRKAKMNKWLVKMVGEATGKTPDFDEISALADPDKPLGLINHWDLKNKRQ